MQTELVRLHRELGITFVCVTHSHSEAFAMADRVVIMDKGTVQQIGAPQQIHRRADNRFVAEFLGASNILDVKVLYADASGVAADSAIGRLSTQAPALKPVQVGEALSLVVAMDRVEIARSLSGAVNQVPGRIAMMEVMGASITAIVETEGGVTLRSQLSSRDIESNPLAVGDTVVASWDPASAYFVAH
nr:TOBE domain-containing protein [Neorhizobium xiangyangii]